MGDRRRRMMRRMFAATSWKRGERSAAAGSVEPALPTATTESFESQGVVAVDPTATLPPQVVRLNVTRPYGAGDRITVSCIDGMPRGRTEAVTLPRPSTDLGEAGRGGRPPSQVLHRIHNWSVANGSPVTGWLSGRRRSPADVVELRIHDETDADIPWELLWLPDNLEHDVTGDYVGCAFATTRWTPLQGIGSVETDTEPDPPRCQGEVLAYLSEELREADLPLMDTLNARTVDSSGLLLRELKDSGKPIAMVYLGAHGVFSRDGFGFKADDVSLGRIYSVAFKRVHEHGPLIFFNVCHSARTILDPEGDTVRPSGFAEVFLRSGAAGFIGTIGAVRETEARQVAKLLLDTLTRRTDTPVAVVLRDYRRELVASLGDDFWAEDSEEEHDRAKSLLYGFMYVYYGNPGATIELPVPRAGSA